MNPERSRRDAIPVAVCCLLSGVAFASIVALAIYRLEYLWAFLSLIAFALACLAVRWFGHTYRALGVILPGTSIGLLATIAIYYFNTLDVFTGILAPAVGAMFGATWKFKNRQRVLSRRASAILCGSVALVAIFWTMIARFGIEVLGLILDDEFSLSGVLFFQALLCLLVAMLLAWAQLFRPFFECCISCTARVGYRIRGTPSNAISVDGPMIVIANHACWWDPLFVAGALPRPITPMMTSVFYDRWFLRPLMVRVFQAIRVEEAKARREAPELQQAIAALDAGKCVLIFPEAYLRRKEEIPLRRFGRGIWEILKRRPNTPIVACWIEGAWGCHSSYFNGPPAKNKKLDFLRPIQVALSEPFQLEPDVLEHHLRTRITLMNHVGQVRTKLGLEPLPPFELPKADDGVE